MFGITHGQNSHHFPSGRKVLAYYDEFSIGIPGTVIRHDGIHSVDVEFDQPLIKVTKIRKKVKVPFLWFFSWFVWTEQEKTEVLGGDYFFETRVRVVGPDKLVYFITFDGRVVDNMEPWNT